MSLKSTNKVDTNRVELEVAVSPEDFEAAVGKAYKKNIRRMNVPGFRKGKAPRHLVEKMYGTGVFYEDAVNDLYPKALDEAINESGYEYVRIRSTWTSSRSARTRAWYSRRSSR